MTGYTVHTGSTIKFSTSWDRIFSEAQSGQKLAAKKQAGGSAKKTTKKPGVKKGDVKNIDPPLKKQTAKKKVSKAVKNRG